MGTRLSQVGVMRELEEVDEQVELSLNFDQALAMFKHERREMMRPKERACWDAYLEQFVQLWDPLQPLARDNHTVKEALKRLDPHTRGVCIRIASRLRVDRFKRAALTSRGRRQEV